MYKDYGSTDIVDIIGRYQSITDISVPAYMFSNMRQC